LDCKQKSHRILAQAAFTLAWLLIAGTPTFAQNIAKPATEQWRPKEGTYADPGADFSLRCGEFGDFIVELTHNSISGSEWSCKITKLTDTAPGAIRLDMICNDYNLAEFINDPNPYERKFKEIMLLRKLDAKSIFVRKTVNGKFKDPYGRASYCPDEAQRMYTEAMARDEAEAERKAAEQQLTRTPWRPKTGVYATPGTNFNDRCLKAGDAILDFDERSITSGTDRCNVTFIRDNLDGIQLFATCNAPPSSESMILRKIDDKTVFLQKTKDGNFSDPGEPLSYCGQDAQEMYAQPKAKK